MNKFLQFCQTMGLHPLVGFGVFAIDWMLFGAEASTLGVGWVISIPVGIVLSVASAFIQKNYNKEVWGLAIGKGLLLGLLTAIPTALPSIVPLIGGGLGVVALLGNNSSQDIEN